MVQQKNDKLRYHQDAADQALALFNKITTTPDHFHIGLPITFLGDTFLLSVNRQTKKALLSYLQKVCEFHMVEKQAVAAGIGNKGKLPALPDWFTKYFTFCSEMKIKPLACDLPAFEVPYTITDKKNGALIIQFDSKVQYRDSAGNVWRASHGGTFEKL